MSRYVVVEGSESAHCCFAASVVDTIQETDYAPHVPAGRMEGRYHAICECMELEKARAIARAMNIAAGLA